VTAADLDRGIRRELESLPVAAADDVARHLVAAGRFADSDPERALAHARAAKRRAGRIAAVREAVGIAAYLCGEWAEALSELRAVRRMTGAPEVVPMMADCERGLGRPERALELLDDLDGVAGVPADVQVEALLVRAGARRDLGQTDAALALLRQPATTSRGRSVPVARVRYAYAEALLAAGDDAGAREWFTKALEADPEGATDAAEQLDALLGVEFSDSEFSDAEFSAAEFGDADAHADPDSPGAG
jgi:tetratricopeptide (TPR) repeat protein